jgi:hypothetical protein
MHLLKNYGAFFTHTEVGGFISYSQYLCLESFFVANYDGSFGVTCRLNFTSCGAVGILYFTTEAKFYFKDDKSIYKLQENLSSKCLHEMLCSPCYPQDVD